MYCNDRLLLVCASWFKHHHRGACHLLHHRSNCCNIQTVNDFCRCLCVPHCLPPTHYFQPSHLHCTTTTPASVSVYYFGRSSSSHTVLATCNNIHFLVLNFSVVCSFSLSLSCVLSFRSLSMSSSISTLDVVLVDSTLPASVSSTVDESETVHEPIPTPTQTPIKSTRMHRAGTNNIDKNRTTQTNQHKSTKRTTHASSVKTNIEAPTTHQFIDTQAELNRECFVLLCSNES